MTFAEVVAMIAAARGRPVGFRRIDPEGFAAILSSAGAPAAAIELVTSLFTELFDGRNAVLGTGIRECLGREPRPFSAYATATAATGMWDA